MADETSERVVRQSGIPAWESADLPEPKPLSWRNWTSFIGPGIVMMGVQIGGGEWLFGPEITARYGGGLMWIATVAIVLQVFYNIECGRYALYCGEPVFTGFMRKWPGPMFWMGLMLLLNGAALIPGLSTHGAAILAAFILDRPPTEADSWLVTWLAYLCLGGVVLPILIGGKVYNTLQGIMTVKVFFILTFCFLVGVWFVEPANWWNVFSGFLKFGQIPVQDAEGQEKLVNAFGHYWEHGSWPTVALANIAVLGGFAGYAGGGGLANSTYSNFVRDKGWGMGSLVGAIPSAVGGRKVSLSHVGKVFPLTEENLRRWSGWWRYIMMDQVIVWGPGCVMGMALPALLSIQFAHNSNLADSGVAWSQALITSDGMRLAPALGPGVTKLLWLVSLLAGMMVMLPSQMSIVDDFSRRWTDGLWTASPLVRRNLKSHQVGRIYYTILSMYVLWSFVCAYLFSTYGTPKLMTLVIANLNNVALGVTAIQLLWINTTLLPAKLRPRWYHVLGLIFCAVFYLGLAGLVFVEKQLPVLVEFLRG
ncbi:MAG: Nramp family divalent metal transporter [Planctomycetaceae bacterium]|nr:Nramp family divalent metal transporter [Planctomycetaceae bacterium]